ncbi:class I SAM-dependent methyltransferase [Larkinella terrae]|uniref:Methyltransferase domain-containing protein n=1 Tax=Larkinella terrae TaxID=2025311 RepID=A0A7K0EVX5_9BACT|nr:class I SAM-dependent methyltransferase [Larkinella terrae]MRS65902.1 methyltransferase domain-containing protein [Larkinella terrae]
MRLTVTPENLLEWIALKINLVPLPLLHAQIFPIVGKAVLEAADKGVFEAVQRGKQTVDEIATDCRLHPKALGELLGLLTVLGYFRYRGGRYTLTRLSSRWLLKNNDESVFGMMLFNNRVVWPWLDQLGNYLQTGEGIQYHDHLTTQQWAYYQQAMLAATGTEAKEFGRKAPVPKTATLMLDIGGSHGQHAVALCRRIPDLQAIILDLPQAIEQAAPLLARAGMGDRIRHQVGNALTDDFGENRYDIVLMSSLAHHFSDEQNREVARKVAKALKPGGVYIINEFIRPEVDGESGGVGTSLVGSSMDLFYGLTSTAGNYSVREIQSWQTAAGLSLSKVKTYLSIPGRAMVVAKK